MSFFMRAPQPWLPPIFVNKMLLKISHFIIASIATISVAAAAVGHMLNCTMWVCYLISIYSDCMCFVKQ